MLLTVSQVAERLGVSTKTVRRLADRRELATTRIGSAVRFDERELERYITENTEAAS